MSENKNNPAQSVQNLLSGVARQQKVTEWERQQHKRLVAEKLRRECESLRLYRPQDFQNAFHKETVRKLLMQKANQVGGTLAAAVEVARAVTGQDPYDKYPKRDGVVCLLGYGESHIGTVFWPKLFRSGAFDIIRDRQTKQWRVFRPWPEADGGDLERDEEKKMAPPLIPARYIEGKPTWVNRGDRIFSTVRFTTGWELRAYNSAGDPGQAQGFQADLYWVDEDVASVGWIIEIAFRLMKRRGLFRWTALPHNKNEEMMRMIEDAEQQAQLPNPTTKLLKVTAFENKYVSNEALTEAIDAAKAHGEDVYRQRILGEHTLSSVRMYPTFNKLVHDVMRSPTLEEDIATLQQTDGKIPEGWSAQRILAARMGEPPDDWTKYVSIDPGSTVLAIMFLCVPPPELGDQVFVYDESYLKDPPVPTEAFGDALQMKCADKVIEAFIFDMHGGKLRSIATGEVPVDQYSDALRERNIRSQSTEFGFRHACDDRKRREEVMRSMLAIQRNGQPQLMVCAGKCPSFVWEMERFKKKHVKQMGKEIPIDEGDRRVNTHAIEAVEGAIGIDIPYVKQRPKKVTSSIVKRWTEFREKIKRRRQYESGGSNHISLGPIGVSQ